MNTSITCLLLAASLCAGTTYAAEPDAAARESEMQKEVQKDIDAIVANCEKKKLPTEQEIECIEQGYLQFMGETPESGS